MSYTFAGYVPNHRCALPCEDNTTFSDPSPEWFKALVDDDDLNTECKFYEFKSDSPIGGGCDADMFDKSKIVPCEHFVYDRSVFDETLVTEFDLVCSKKWKKGFIGNVFALYVLPCSLMSYSF